MDVSILHIGPSGGTNAFIFEQLGTRLFILSRINKDYNKQSRVNSRLSVIRAFGDLGIVDKRL